MKYRIIILIIIIKRLGEILLSYMANTSHTHARTHPVSMYFPSQHFMVLLVDDVVSRPITPEIHLLSLTIFTQEALVTQICMNLSVSYPNWYELIRMCKLPVGEEPHLWPALQTEWVEKAVSCLHL